MYKKLVFIILFALNAPVHAMWQKMTDAQLVDNSVLIVNATLIAKPQLQLDSPLSLGILRVNRVYLGDAATQGILIKLPFIAPVNNKGVRTVYSNDLNYALDQAGIWFLRKDKGDLYYADHPQRFWPNNKEETLKQLLNAKK